MIVQYNSKAFTTSQYLFADPEMIKLYSELFGLDKSHRLIRITI
jgi:hypothetical protein